MLKSISSSGTAPKHTQALQYHPAVRSTGLRSKTLVPRAVACVGSLLHHASVASFMLRALKPRVCLVFAPKLSFAGTFKKSCWTAIRTSRQESGLLDCLLSSVINCTVLVESWGVCLFRGVTILTLNCFSCRFSSKWISTRGQDA